MRAEMFLAPMLPPQLDSTTPPTKELRFERPARETLYICRKQKRDNGQLAQWNLGNSSYEHGRSMFSMIEDFAEIVVLINT
jgi:hypothetical protein